MAVALDSNAVIGFLDKDDAFHEAADAKLRERLGEGERLHASVVTYAEVLAGAKLGHHDEAVVRGFFAELISGIAPVDKRVAERAAELRGQRRFLEMPDALILATADLDDDVERIVCADDVARKIADLVDCKVEPLSPIG